MKYEIPKLLQDYQDELNCYLENTSDYNWKTAEELGKRALDLGLNTRAISKLHQQSFIDFNHKQSSDFEGDEAIRLAGVFFAEVIAPIEENLKAVKEFNSELLAQSLHLQEELRLLTRRLLLTQEEERRRISQELHDIVTQTLTVINVRLSALTLLADANTNEMLKKITETQKLVEHSVDIVHRFTLDLRPTVLDDLGLIPALKSYLQDFMERSGIRASLTAFEGTEDMDTEVRTVLYRVAQEALNNVEQHSKATNATISIRKYKGVTRMEIHDDGEGFEVDSHASSLNSHRLGLLGMEERVKMIGGEFHVLSELGKETTIRVDVPRTSDISSCPDENKFSIKLD